MTVARRTARWPRVARLLAAVATASLLAAACSSDTGPAEGGTGDGMVAQVASFDLAAGSPARFLVGLAAPGFRFVSYGTVELSFTFLGSRDGRERLRGPRVTGEFLALPGSPRSERPGPAALPASEGRGVYAAEVGFDRPGFWEVEVTADLVDSGAARATSAFEVFAEHAVPAPGDQAPRSRNLTLDSLASEHVPPSAVDSRADSGRPIPDPELHGTTIAEALDRGRPVLAALSTPVYCVSRFCGPVTDMVSALAADYADRAEFVHVEIWRDFESQTVNPAAEEWLLRRGELNEPWVFLIGGDGTILARWDNVATRAEIEPWLERLAAAS